MSYPALLAVGIPPLPASVANNVALVACWPGSAVASRPELRGRGRWVRRHLAVVLVGGVAGSVLLLATPSQAFERIVPLLVAVGSVALLLEPRLTARRGEAGWRGERVALPIGLLVLSFYNGYFGAGSGVLTLTLVLVLVEQHLPTANALKNMLIGAAAIASAGTFVLAAPVRWSAVLPLAVGMLLGSGLGPRVARRVPAPLLRVVIALLGLGLAVDLAL